MENTTNLQKVLHLFEVHQRIEAKASEICQWWLDRSVAELLDALVDLVFLNFLEIVGLPLDNKGNSGRAEMLERLLDQVNKKPDSVVIRLKTNEKKKRRQEYLGLLRARRN